MKSKFYPKLIDLFDPDTKPAFLGDMHHSVFGLLQMIGDNKVISSDQDTLEAVDELLQRGYVVDNPNQTPYAQYFYPVRMNLKGLWLLWAMKYLLNQKITEWSRNYYNQARKEMGFDG